MSIQLSMSPILRWFDEWTNRGSYSPSDLARFRVLFAVLGLLHLPAFSWVAELPDSFYNPPPGPMQLFGGFPPAWVMHGLEMAYSSLLVAVLIGWRTRWASILLAVVGIAGYGFTYSLGKIDHNILIVILPAFLAFAGWGGSGSVDAVHGRSRAHVSHWALRLYAFAIGIAMVTAALPKARGGWLDTSVQAVWAQVLIDHSVRDVNSLLGATLMRFDSPALWEAADWATVFVEGIVVLAAFRWSLFRSVLAVLAVFHLFVLLTLDITFTGNLIAYGAFIHWGGLTFHTRLSRKWHAAPRYLANVESWRRLSIVIAAGLLAWLVLPRVPDIGAHIRIGIHWLAGAIGLWYLVRKAFLGVRARSPAAA